ncbi:MAG: DUF5671 domain-containing protein [Zoogloeaceae bacterium]|jgi:hypothetical protein|nr:DUF5671 domain-containing protein [Zoogloeaceae bacterium]
MASSIQDLERFIRAALEKGATKPEIEQCLLQANWPADQIKVALNQFADIAFVVPVPKPRPYLSAREAFFYLLLFTALYLGACYLGSLLFSFVALGFPDPTLDMDYYWNSRDDRIRLAVSFLVVTYPVFLFMSWRIQRELANDPVKRQSLVRRWLTWLTLFVSGAFVIGDLVVLVYNVLGGELTIRFFLKVLIVGVIAGTIFWFYLWELRDEGREACRLAVMKRLAVTVSAVVVASLIGAAYVLDSPMEQRQRKLDNSRLQNLEEIGDSVKLYAKNHQALPPDLATLEEEAKHPLPTDPDTGERYEYQTLDATSYQLCAVFSLPSRDEDGLRRQTHYRTWERTHAAGKQCFKRTLDSDGQK